ncbi:MAG: TRAP transporter TatT component family protein, partial [Treponema sp.]|nr:TRAP transporter TatT component family protein [Treponema sp.]
QLVEDAIPFAIKLYESLLAQNPDHQGLILTTGSLFVMYANAFVQGPAEMLPVDRVDDYYAATARAKKLYIRGADIILSGLDKKYPGWKDAAENETLDQYLGKTKKEDVPALYWTVAGLLSAYSMDVFDFELGMRLPELTAMIKRAYELDPDFNRGALDEFFILFYSSIPEGLGGDPSMVEPHFQKAVEKSGGLSAGPYVSYAQSVCRPAQDYKSFKEYLEKALAIDVDADPANRLVNVLAQKKARYLLDTASDIFLVGAEDE